MAGIRNSLAAMLLAVALCGCEPGKQAVPDPASPPKPKVAPRRR